MPESSDGVHILSFPIHSFTWEQVAGAIANAVEASPFKQAEGTKMH